MWIDIAPLDSATSIHFPIQTRRVEPWQGYSQVGMSENVTPSEGTLETDLFYYIMNTFAL